MRGIRAGLAGAAVRAAACCAFIWALTAVCAHAHELSKELNETVVMIPKPRSLSPAQLETTIFKPDGEGPFPVAIINHGKALGDPAAQPRYRPLRGARFFLARGYVVAVPMRQGFSKSTGGYVGAGCNLGANGLAQAEDLQAVLEYMAKQPFADKHNVLVVGQSHGGWTTLAFGTLNYPGVKGLVNFAGGLKQTSCAAWEGTLARTAGYYAKSTRLPSLWFYGDNDSYFEPHLFRSMHEAYTANGGMATLVAFGKFGQDAHGLFGSSAGELIWHPQLASFLRAVGLPHEVVLPKYGVPTPAASHFAPLERVEGVPYLNDNGRKGYVAFLDREAPRAFALAPGGAWGWANGGDDPLQRALDNCNRNGRGLCRLYAVDDAVVW